MNLYLIKNCYSYFYGCLLPVPTYQVLVILSCLLALVEYSATKLYLSNFLTFHVKLPGLTSSGPLEKLGWEQKIAIGIWS